MNRETHLITRPRHSLWHTSISHPAAYNRNDVTHYAFTRKCESVDRNPPSAPSFLEGMRWVTIYHGQEVHCSGRFTHLSQITRVTKAWLSATRLAKKNAPNHPDLHLLSRYLHVNYTRLWYLFIECQCLYNPKRKYPLHFRVTYPCGHQEARVGLHAL